MSAISVELPEEISREVERLAHERGMTPAEFVARAAAEKVGAAAEAAAYFAERAKRAQPGAAKRFFGRGGGVRPRPGDEA